MALCAECKSIRGATAIILKIKQISSTGWVKQRSPHASVRGLGVRGRARRGRVIGCVGEDRRHRVDEDECDLD